MADIKDNKEQIKGSEKIALKQEVGFAPEELRVPEKRDFSKEERIISEQLRREIEMIEVDETTKKEAEIKAKKIEFLGEEDKIKHLLEMAKTKGLVFAIQVARKMNEPYLLDILHDTLAQEGYYKDFTK